VAVPRAGETSSSVKDKLATLLGGTTTVIDKTRTMMTLEDPWFFGLGRGQKIAVEQRVVVKPIPPNPVAELKEEKGKDVLVGPVAVAHLADKSPGVIINPVGKGEIVWLPHRMVPVKGTQGATATGMAEAVAADFELKNADLLRPQKSYYAALAAYMQPALIEVHDGDAARPGAHAMRVALRATATGTWLVALSNIGTDTGSVTLTVNHHAGVALDLNDEKELPLTARGNFTTVPLTIPGNGWKLIAFAENRKELDQERNARTAVAKLR
jgi:hypothetical protein